MALIGVVEEAIDATLLTDDVGGDAIALKDLAVAVDAVDARLVPIVLRDERLLDRMQKELASLKKPPPSTAIRKTQGDLPWPVQGSMKSYLPSFLGT